MSTLNGNDGFQIALGGDFRDRQNRRVTAVGDINGDSIGDLSVAPTNTSDLAYVVYGSTTAFGRQLDLDTIDGSTGFVMDFNRFTERTSHPSVRLDSAGDFNGDGLDDIIVGLVYGRSFVSQPRY